MPHRRVWYCSDLHCSHHVEKALQGFTEVALEVGWSFDDIVEYARRRLQAYERFRFGKHTRRSRNSRRDRETKTRAWYQERLSKGRKGATLRNENPEIQYLIEGPTSGGGVELKKDMGASGGEACSTVANIFQSCADTHSARPCRESQKPRYGSDSTIEAEKGIGHSL